MENKLEKRYGLITAITMVAGIVIGSGVFFKAEKILNCTGGNMMIGVTAWVIGGSIMVACAYTFANMAAKYEKVNGIVDYAEEMLGSAYGYYAGWFLATMYYPSMTSVLAWVSGKYICVLLGWDVTGGACMAIAGFCLVASYAVNTLSPVLAGRFQVSATFIKMIPLVLMSVLGTIKGMGSGMMERNFTQVAAPAEELGGTGHIMFVAVCATSFAYEGWIIATSINAELKDSRKNLPRALVIGTAIVMTTYVAYYIGVSGAVENTLMMKSGEAGARLAFAEVFSETAGDALFIFLIISCLGSLNGMMLGCVRGFYALGIRNDGPRPEVFRNVDPVIKMPVNSAVMGLLICAFWLLYLYGSSLAENSWFGPFGFDSSELPIVSIYFFYIPVFVMIMKKETEWGSFRRFVMPALSICGSAFMLLAGAVSHKSDALFYLAFFAIVMMAGYFANRKKGNGNGYD